MDILDRVFRVVFARYRRKMGDRGLESAWRSASNEVCGYLALPVAALALVMMAAAYSLVMTGTHPEHKRWGQIAAGVTGVAVALLLDRRFRKYLTAPPHLDAEESNADARFLFCFRAISIGTFAVTCLVGFYLRGAGVEFLKDL
ncbi:MAG TPA: hypothetical protein VFW40_07975 [Capsulimonadaceae bacterium]|nr:hypothetical protein [Capsulimonadaceae bacterium]